MTFSLCLLYCLNEMVIVTLPMGGVQITPMTMSVCWSVCPLAYVKNHMSKLSEIFLVTFSMSRPSLTTVQCIMSHNGANTDIGLECV